LGWGVLENKKDKDNPVDKADNPTDQAIPSFSPSRGPSHDHILYHILYPNLDQSDSHDQDKDSRNNNLILFRFLALNLRALFYLQMACYFFKLIF
jgi:hypothetical protein